MDILFWIEDFTESLNPNIVGAVFGISFGVSAAFYLVAKIVKKRCDQGDSTAKIEDFSTRFYLTKTIDDVSRNYYKK